MSTENKTPPFSMNRFLLKVKYAFYSTLVFLIFANPETLKLLQTGLGYYVTFSNNQGLATTAGLFTMCILFFFTMLALMMLPSE